MTSSPGSNASGRLVFGRAELAVLTAVLLWGTNFTAAKFVLRTVPTLALAPLRFVVAAALLLAILAWRERSLRLSRRELASLLWIGAIGFGVNQLGFLGGLSLTDASSAALIFMAAPLVVAVLAAWRFNEPLSRLALAGLVLATVGVILVVAPHGLQAGGGRKWQGDLLIIATVSTIVFSALAVKAPLRRMSTLKVTAWSTAGGALFLLLVGGPVWSTYAWGSISGLTWAGIAFVVLGATVGTNLLWNFGLGALGAARVMAFTYLEPMVAVAMAWVLLGERMVLLQWLGGAVIIAGLAVHTLGGGHAVATGDEPALGVEWEARAEEASGIPRQRD